LFVYHIFENLTYRTLQDTWTLDTCVSMEVECNQLWLFLLLDGGARVELINFVREVWMIVGIK